jgi:hypothetical protein
VFAADGTELIVGSRSGAVGVFDAGSGRRLRDLVPGGRGFDHLAQAPDGSRVVLGATL